MKIASGSAIAAGAFAAPPAEAANFEVTNLSDAGAGSLRDAVAQANATAGADTVTFQSGLTGTIGLTTGEVDIEDSLTITGPGATQLTVSGSGNSRVFDAGAQAGVISVAISGLTVSDGNAYSGGGIYGYQTELSLNAVTVSGSTAAGGVGGGVGQRGPDGSLSVVDSTISGNTAEIGEEGGGDGGGIYRGSGEMEIVNSTISGNSAVDGGGIYSCYCNGVSDIRSTTIAGNDADDQGGGVFRPLTMSNTNTVNLDSTIVAGNTAATGADLYETGTGAGSQFTAGFSLIEDTSGATIAGSPGNNIFGADPALGPLANNGGQTATHLPASASPAIDKGLSPGLGTDQRGAVRVQDDAGIGNAPGGDGSEIGSVEVPAPGSVAAGTIGGQPAAEKDRGRFCLDRRATIVGTIKDDTLIGTRGVDVIRGMRGNDRIKGLEGDDIICGDRGRDVINGGRDDDKARGGIGGDVVRGDVGDDLLRGGAGRDRIFGEEGDDAIFGGARLGKAHIPGPPGEGVGNLCDGGAGNDTAAGCEHIVNAP